MLSPVSEDIGELEYEIAGVHVLHWRHVLFEVMAFSVDFSGCGRPTILLIPGFSLL